MYGMGEHSILEIAEALDSGIAVQDITYIRGTVFKCRDLEELSGDYELLPSYEEITESKETFAQSYYRQYVNTDAITAKRLVEPYKRRNILYRIHHHCRLRKRKWIMYMNFLYESMASIL